MCRISMLMISTIHLHPKQTFSGSHSSLSTHQLSAPRQQLFRRSHCATVCLALVCDAELS